MLNCQGQRQLLRRYGTCSRFDSRTPARPRVSPCFAAKGSCKESQGLVQKPTANDTVAKDAVQIEPQDDPVIKTEKGWSTVRDILLEKGYADESIVAAVGFQEMQNSADFDPALVLNNIVALGLIIHNPDDVKYLVRSEPRILQADLLAWSGLLHTLGVSINFLLNVNPRLFVSCTANSCMPTVDHLLRHNPSPDHKALGVKVKRNPSLLALPESSLDATDAALGTVGLKPAPMRVMLAARPEIYLRHNNQPEAYIKDLAEGCSTLVDHNLDPNDIFPHIASVVSRPMPGKRILEKFDALYKLGLEKLEVGDIVRACPGVLLLSGAELQRKWSYLRVVLHGGKEELLEYPEFLLLQFTRDIAPAFAYLVQSNEQHRVRGGPNGKVSLELLAKEATRLRADYVFQDFVSRWKFDMRH